MTPLLIGAVVVMGLYTLGKRGSAPSPPVAGPLTPSAGWAPDWLTPGAPRGPGAPIAARAVSVPLLWAPRAPGAVQGPEGVEVGLSTGAKVAGVAAAGTAIASPLIASIFGIFGSVAGLALGAKQGNPLSIAQSSVNVGRQGYSIIEGQLADTDLLSTSGLEFGAELPSLAPTAVTEVAPSDRKSVV